MKVLLHVLDSYLHLEPGWDGYDGVPATLTSVADAAYFALALLPQNVVVPCPEIGGDGEVGLYWRSDKAIVEISFDGEGRYSWYARGYGSPMWWLEFGSGEHDLRDDGASPDLMEILEKYFRKN
jgi:hypothetical protein